MFSERNMPQCCSVHRKSQTAWPNRKGASVTAIQRPNACASSGQYLIFVSDILTEVRRKILFVCCSLKLVRWGGAISHITVEV
jgi:hypothetical protein